MLDSRSPEAAKRSAASKQPSRPARADDASTSTTPRSTPSAAGGDTSPKKAPTSPDPHRCFSTRTTGRQHPTRSHSSSPGPFSQTDLPYIRFHDLRHTHTPHSSSPPASRSRSSPNGSVTPTPASQCTPTNTSSPKWAPAPRESSPNSSILPAGRRLPNKSPETHEFCKAHGRQAGRRPPHRKTSKGPESLRFRAFSVVAGAGFEPATFGL